MREGRQMGIFDRAEATEEKVMAAATGQSESPKEGSHQMDKAEQ
jgi:hypothetical protein